ncbi:MAG: glycosyltransferase [Candidatus Izimaplasma sp.]|nr:glycosyltransferase [Candidatus Izimaplasma bacterium]
MRILFLNPQGNFDQNDSYWTEHPDFGGQLVYVKEIASEMSKLGHHVDIVTRQIIDSDWPEFNDTLDSYKELDHLRIVRIPCGPKHFLRKELLWEHIEEWVDNIIAFYQKEGQTIDFVTGHYGDGGLAAAMLKDKIDVPYSFTGHSLGAQKLDKLNGSLDNYKKLDEQYHFTKRLLAENTAIKYSDIIFVSTEQEKLEQYTHPLYKESSHNKQFEVAPPGANTTVFAKYNGHNIDPSTKEKVDTVIKRDIDSDRQDLAMIISASRLDPKKNHVGLVRAFAKSDKLRSKMNLMISLRGIDNAFQDYSMAKPKEQTILDEIFELIDTHDLKGEVSFVSINSQDELADTYRYLTTKQGIFTLTALYEPFGLAPIEAMSTGLPVVVTKYGGPQEVLYENGEDYGVLVDVKDDADIAKGLLEALEKYAFYQKQGEIRVFSKYTWKQTAKHYLKAIDQLLNTSSKVDIPTYFYSLDETDLKKYSLLEDYLKKTL